MVYDVVIVGAGPAGLSAAIRIRQADASLSVIVLEKGSEVGAHTLSGAVLDPAGLDVLFPGWREEGAPVSVGVSDDRFYVLGEGGQVRIPGCVMPPLMSNRGAYIVSMGAVCRWLAERAESLGVEIYASMSCSEPVFGDVGQVTGVVAGEFCKRADGRSGESGVGYDEPGVEVTGKYVLIAEGARGSLAKVLISRFALDSGIGPQKFGLGLKEVWEVDTQRYRPGMVEHMLGWPLWGSAGGGGFVYHADGGRVSVGYVMHLDYVNPYLSPYMEFQRFKHHGLVSGLLCGGRRIAYGARVISEGGIQSVPRMVFPGGALLGCSAGMVNVPRIKGNHNAMLSGIAAADAVVEAIGAGRSGDVLESYEASVRGGVIGRDLRLVRNVKPLWSALGTLPALVLGGLDMWVQTITGGLSLFGTLNHARSDAGATGRAEDFAPVAYPAVDGVLSFDRATSVGYAMTRHSPGQASHLHLADSETPIRVNLPRYAEPAQRYCPAAVYEVVADCGGSRFVVNSGNCIHCKACDIKDPSENITWRPPRGGDGPNYRNM